MVARRIHIVAVLALLTAPACVSSAVSSRAAYEFGCLQVRITVEELGEGRYVAEGCDLRATYACSGSTCVRDSEIEDRGPARRAAEAPDAYLSNHSEDLRRCAGSEGELTLLFGPRGDLEEISGWEGETPEARLCLSGALAGTRLDAPPLEAMAVRVDLAPMEIIAVDHRPRPPGPSAPAAEDAPTEEVLPTAEGAPAPDTAAAEEQLRATLDGHQSDILDCAGTDRVIVQVEWTESSPPRISVQGELAGTPREGCVRAALADDLTVAPMSSGSLLHLVTR